MAKEKVSKIYAHANFGAVVMAFLATIIIVLIAGVLFMRFRPAPKEHHRTGMVLLLPQNTVRVLAGNAR